MVWIDIGALDADRRDWQLTQPFTGNLIKIVNEVSAIPSQTSNFRGLIAVNYGFEDFLEIKEFFSIPKSQIFLFSNLDLGTPKFLAVSNLTSRSSAAQWTIRAYVWDEIINDIPDIVVDSVELSSNSLEEINTLINTSLDNAVNQIENATAITTQQTIDFLTFMTGAI